MKNVNKAIVAILAFLFPVLLNAQANSLFQREFNFMAQNAPFWCELPDSLRTQVYVEYDSTGKDDRTLMVQFELKNGTLLRSLIWDGGETGLFLGEIQIPDLDSTAMTSFKVASTCVTPIMDRKDRPHKNALNFLRKYGEIKLTPDSSYVNIAEKKFQDGEMIIYTTVGDSRQKVTVFWNSVAIPAKKREQYFLEINQDGAMYAMKLLVSNKLVFTPRAPWMIEVIKHILVLG